MQKSVQYEEWYTVYFILYLFWKRLQRGTFLVESNINASYFLLFSSGERLGPFGASDTIWPIVATPDDNDDDDDDEYECGAVGGM
jgi:hypothetical protein